MTRLQWVWLEARRIGVGVKRGDPVTATLIAGGITAAISASAAVMQGQQQSSAYKAQAQSDEYNAQLARNSGQIALEGSAANEASQRRKSMGLEGAQYAALSENNPNSPTSDAVVRQQAINDQLDALNIRYQGKIANYGYQNQALSNEYDASVNRWNAGNASTGGWLTAASTLAGAGAQGYATYKKSPSMGSPDMSGDLMRNQNWMIPGAGGYDY